MKIKREEKRPDDDSAKGTPIIQTKNFYTNQDLVEECLRDTLKGQVQEHAVFAYYKVNEDAFKKTII